MENIKKNHIISVDNDVYATLIRIKSELRTTGQKASYSSIIKSAFNQSLLSKL